MISITTEPKEDGSRELLAYAKAQGVNADGWVFPDRRAREDPPPPDPVRSVG